MTVVRTAEERLILARAALIKAEESRERKAKLRAERKERGTLHRGQERDNGFRQYIRRQPCEAAHKGGCTGPIQHCHISYRVAGIANSFGRSVKNHDRHGNPLCAGHHHIQTNVMGEKSFWEWLGKDAYETAARHFARYQGVTDEGEALGGYGDAESVGMSQAEVSPPDLKGAGL